MGKIISNGINYSGLINAQGVFIDINNLIYSNVTSLTSESYTATEDCYIMQDVVCGSGQVSTVKIDNITVAEYFYQPSSVFLIPYTIFLKKGQVLSVKHGASSSHTVNVYGVQQGSTSGLIDYSTNEQYTGQHWIDGKPIYQKTIEIQASSLTGGQENTVIHGISNFGQLVKKESIYNYTNGDMNTDVANPTNNSWFIQVHDVGDTDFDVYVGSSAYAQLSKIYVTFQYTKSST